MKNTYNPNGIGVITVEYGRCEDLSPHVSYRKAYRLHNVLNFFTAGKSCGKLRGKFQQENVKGKSGGLTTRLDERKEGVKSLAPEMTRLHPFIGGKCRGKHCEICHKSGRPQL
jgi:hypothetical protein